MVILLIFVIYSHYTINKFNNSEYFDNNNESAESAENGKSSYNLTWDSTTIDKKFDIFKDTRQYLKKTKITYMFYRH